MIPNSEIKVHSIWNTYETILYLNFQENRIIKRQWVVLLNNNSVEIWNLIKICKTCEWKNELFSWNIYKKKYKIEILS